MDAGVCRVIGAAAILCLIGSNAAAHEKKVSVALAGKISPKCVLSNPNAGVDLGPLQPKGTASVSFSLTCNADFHFTLSSRNGGLLQAGAIAQPPYIALIPYTASLYLGGERISRHHGCKSEHMTGALPSCSGFAGANVTAASGQNASLRLSWDYSGSALMAGTFRDTLLLKVGPEF
jgi:hypothetical protein